MQVVIQIVQTLIENLPLILDAALQLITGLAQGCLLYTSKCAIPQKPDVQEVTGRSVDELQAALNAIKNFM